MTYILRVTFCLFYCIFSYAAIGQSKGESERADGFKVDLLVGSNFSQLAGDGLDGYRKLGLRAGAQINYQLYRRGGLAIGLLYEEKGSSNIFSLRNNIDKINTKLQFLTIPIDFFFLASYNPAIEQHRLKYNLGLSIGRLFNVTTNDQIYDQLENSFNTFDIALNIGLTYYISKKSGLNIRWEQSITKILSDEIDSNLVGLRSYQISIQYLYSL